MDQHADSALRSSHWTSPVHARFRQRDQALLKLGEALVKEQGLVSFRFSELAPRAGCSAGTLYKHFNCKEDLLVAIFAKHIELLTERQPELISAELSHAERLLALHLYGALAMKHSCWSLGFNALAGVDGIIERVSDYRLQEMQMFIEQTHSTSKRVMESARIESELTITDAEVQVAHLTLVACQRGAMTMIGNPLMGTRLNIDDSQTLYQSLSMVISSLNWKHPLTTDSQQRIFSLVEQQLQVLEQEHELGISL
ncbi:TetR/AcrR family transcriptional regulator [Ferrimonas aestuarii]|uniref:TetR/AcrR family transcriptional regulator n=1 Tax=Ferrimonas aestuarii TaxID=2569539 RepID=A0A4U1BL11_9GAMM|nr:TetR/AcrR family transcriptional regulator [Ferrimonas aestuarii]TKB53042.1 TetR/AcrR family transcriptional regulator [Ferrimonas aestuarii]